MSSSLKTSTKTQVRQRHGTKIFIINKETRYKVKKSLTTTNKTIKKRPCISRPTPSTTNTSTFDGLKSKLDFSYDSLATILVIFDSLKFTYANNQNEFDRLRNNTRLGDIEKELLTAYDDLTLQVSHLKKDVDNLEKQMRDNRYDGREADTCVPRH